MNSNFDLIVKYAPDNKLDWYPHKMSTDGGKTFKWIGCHRELTLPEVIKLTVNRLAVDRYLLPAANLPKGTAICSLCRNKGKIGVMKFKCFKDGSEATAVVRLEGDVEVSYDEWYYVRYRIDKCDRCGDEVSDYG